MPPVTRDLSVAVAAGDDEETLGDRVRDALGAGASCVEHVSVLSSPPSRTCRPRDQPPRRPAGAGGNLLVASCWDLEKTLTGAEANALRNRVYQALHQGAGTSGREVR
jgi:phenylalanyl-tRNA synthetase alpha chain